MKNIIRNRTILGKASILLSLIICFGLTPLFNEAVSAKVTVVRVKSEIEKGELITESKLQTIEVGGYNLASDVVKSKADIVGKYAKSNIYKNDYISASKLSDQPLANYGYLNEFNGEERAVSVTIKSFAAGLSGKLEPGDIVSILVADYGELKETISPAELQYVQVLAVTAGTGLDTDEYEKNTESIEKDKELPSTLTLRVSANQARILTELEVKGKIHAVFVYRGNKDNANKFLEEQKKILEVPEVEPDEEQAIDDTSEESEGGLNEAE